MSECVLKTLACRGLRVGPSLKAFSRKGGRGEKTPTPKISALLRKRPVLLSGPISSLLRTENGFTTDIFVVKCTGRGLVVKRPGVLSKVQMLNLVLGVGVFSLLPMFSTKKSVEILSSQIVGSSCRANTTNS